MLVVIYGRSRKVHAHRGEVLHIDRVYENRVGCVEFYTYVSVEFLSIHYVKLERACTTVAITYYVAIGQLSVERIVY